MDIHYAKIQDWERDRVTEPKHEEGMRQVQHLDADAVCVQCGTVNPEETLLCKVCGNNLRDQRTIRLSAGDVLQGEVAPSDRRQWIVRGLTVLALLIVLWISLNVTSITQILIEAQYSGSNTAGDPWDGPSAAVYNALSAKLSAAPLSEEDIQRAMAAQNEAEAIGGVYVLAISGSHVGSAIIEQSEAQGENQDAWRFVAEVKGGAEVRGLAELRGGNLRAKWDDVGVFYRGAYYSASGVAMKQPDGSFECFGQSEESDGGFEFLAFHLPSS